MANGKPRFYWDTAPIISWISDERRPKSEMDGLAEVIDMVECDRAILMTSVLWRAEVLDRLNKPQIKKLEEAFQTRSLIELGIDSRIMSLTGEIRAFHRLSKKKDGLKNISVPDAIHLATAIHYDASEFHTFDGSRKSGAHGGLLTLNGNVAGHRIKVCTPMADQLRLDFAAGDIHDHDESDSRE